MSIAAIVIVTIPAAAVVVLDTLGGLDINAFLIRCNQLGDGDVVGGPGHLLGISASGRTNRCAARVG